MNNRESHPFLVESDNFKEPARVILASRNFHPELGGASERFRRYLPELRNYNVHIEVLCTTRDPNLPKGTITYNDTLVHRKFMSEQTPALTDLTLAQESLKLIENKPPEEKPHAVQFFGVRSNSIRYLWQLKKRKIHIIHVATMFADHVSKAPPLIKRWASHIRNRFTESFCTKVVVSSKALGADRIQWGATPAQIHIISNGVNLKRFYPITNDAKLDLRKKMGIPSSSLVILYLGVMTPRKRVDWIIRAFHEVKNKMPQIQLHLVGPHERPTMHDLKEAEKQTSYYENLKRLAGDELDKSIFFHGMTETPEDWFRVADVLAFASINEGLANVLLETMACGTPLVCTPIRGMPEELGVPGTHYLATADTNSSFCKGLIEICTDPQMRSSLAFEAFNNVKENHDLEKTIEEYAKLYHSMKQHYS